MGLERVTTRRESGEEGGVREDTTEMANNPLKEKSMTVTSFIWSPARKKKRRTAKPQGKKAGGNTKEK